jgi:hypothetical protein
VTVSQQTRRCPRGLAHRCPHQGQHVQQLTRAGSGPPRPHVLKAFLLREGTSLTISTSLAMLSALEPLTITFQLKQEYDNGSIHRAIVTTCLHLRHLNFTVACRPSLAIVSQNITRISPSNYICMTNTRKPLHRSSARSASHARSSCQRRAHALCIVPSPGKESLCTCGAHASPCLSSSHMRAHARSHDLPHVHVHPSCSHNQPHEPLLTRWSMGTSHH